MNSWFDRFKDFFKNKYVLISFIVLVLSFFLVFLVYVVFVPKIIINGKEKVVLQYNDKYSENGAYVLGDDDGVEIEGKVDTSKIGEYEVVYKYKKFGITFTKKRIVEVKDEKGPDLVLTGEDEVNVCPNRDYEEEGYKSVDEYDGDITDQVVVNREDDQITYISTDKSGNKTTVFRKIVKEDNVKPVITLKGNSVMYVVVGSKFTDPSVKVVDNCDSNLEEKVVTEGNVDINKVGKYTIKYKVIDSSNNTSEVTRVVNVVNKNTTNSSRGIPGVIYLTFDDGPNSGTTNVILDILKEEGVKATFFVTMRGPDSLIKREFDEGHTVALHTASHNYKTVYTSVDGYFKDLNKVSNRVEKITGVKSMIIRFPGGSSNTVSRHYNIGIMTTLTSEVLNRGYRYYDWNISSGDAGETKNKDKVYANVVNNLSKKRANVVLMHDIKPYTRDALRKIIKYGKENGYTFERITMDTPMVTQRVNN